LAVPILAGEKCGRTSALQFEMRPSFYHIDLAFFLHLRGRTEAAMKQDLCVGVGGVVAVGLAIWGLCGNPRQSAPREHVAQHLNVDPGLKIVNERSPYMRTER
jgi:hypothetical protein